MLDFFLLCVFVQGLKEKCCCYELSWWMTYATRKTKNPLNGKMISSVLKHTENKKKRKIKESICL